MADTVELSNILFHLSTSQIAWLVKRFTGCDSDKDACDATEVAERTLYRWKTAEWFSQAYQQFTLVGSEIFRPLVQAIFESTAAVAAIEQRKLIETPNDKLDSRGVAAKGTAIGDVLDRAIPRRTVTEHTYVFKLSELAKVKQLAPVIIEGEYVAQDQEEKLPQEQGTSSKEEIDATNS